MRTLDLVRRFRAVCRPVLLCLAALALLLQAGCGADPTTKKGAAAVDAGAGTGADAGADAIEVDSGPALTLKWTELLPDTTTKMRAAAGVPGKIGSYVIVGEKATVLRLDGAVFTDISPTTIGKPDLNAVWVDADGTIVAAGAESTLITYDGTSWQVAGSIPPSPPVTFLAVHGVPGGKLWAVGEAGQAYTRDKAIWAPAAVSVTASGGEAIGADADFVDVRVTKAGSIWVAVSKGATSAGAVVRSVDGQTWTGVGVATPPRALWVDGADDSKSGSALVVGGTTSAFVARWDGSAFVDAGDVKWSLGFRAATGLNPAATWIGGLKGQVRGWDGKAWSVVNIAPPPGTVGGFPTPSGDVLSIAAHDADEVLVLTAFKLYRRGRQP